MTDILKTNIRPESVEQHLQALVDGIADIKATETELGLDIQNMVEILDLYRHNNDRYHNGETVLEHTRWVVEDVRKLTKRKTARDNRPILSLVALLHDLGKGYTYKLIDGRHTFRKHAEVSVKLTQAMLWKLRRDDPSTYETVEDLVRMHGAFMELLESRKGAKNLRYLKRFMRERIYPDNLQYLIRFSYADGARARVFQETSDGIIDLVSDMMRIEYERIAAEEVRDRWINPPKKLQRAVRELLEAEAPDLTHLLPDIRGVNRALGDSGRYGTIHKIQKLVIG